MPNSWAWETSPRKKTNGSGVRAAECMCCRLCLRQATLRLGNFRFPQGKKGRAAVTRYFSDLEEDKRKRRPSRGMYVLPSLFSAGNISAGYDAITQSIQGSAADHSYFDHAALAIGLAALFDGVDGYIARLTNTASDFGRELDSLADVITFGVAPSLLAYIWGFQMLPLTVYPTLRDNVVHAGIFVCFLFLICGASRLARFNISINPQPRNPGKPGSKFFVGMPIPAGAGVIAAVVHCFDGSPIYNPWTALVWLLLILF